MFGLALTLAGGLLLWLAWVGSQRPPTHEAACQAAAAPLGVGGGAVAICGVAVVFTGLDAIGAGLVVAALVALAVSVVTATVAALRAVRVSRDPGSGPR